MQSCQGASHTGEQPYDCAVRGEHCSAVEMENKGWETDAKKVAKIAKGISDSTVAFR